MTPNRANENRIVTVSELNGLLKALFDSEPLLSGLCVRGELSNYKIYPSGHHYFTLKDAGSQMRCVMFKGSASKLRFKPENGMKALAFGRVAVYPRDGAYQLYCESITPEGVGDLHILFEQLKEKLSKEGLFDDDRKKPIPRFPRKIAVITSSAGAAVRDIIRILGTRWPLAEVVLLPVRVQGAEAPPEIVGAIRYANKYRVADVIITGRGGGSMEDLWAFNDERVARAISESELPVISAVGHEPDVTIADYVADLRAATPSNAAELAVPDAAELGEALAGYDIRLTQNLTRRLAAYSARLEELANRRVLKSPTGYIDERRMALDGVRERLNLAFAGILRQKEHEFARLSGLLDAMSPLKVISRGFAIASGADGGLIKSVADAEEGSRIKIRLSDGELACLVEEVNQEYTGGRIND